MSCWVLRSFNFTPSWFICLWRWRPGTTTSHWSWCTKNRWLSDCNTWFTRCSYRRSSWYSNRFHLCQHRNSHRGVSQRSTNDIYQQFWCWSQLKRLDMKFGPKEYNNYNSCCTSCITICTLYQYNEENPVFPFDLCVIRVSGVDKSSAMKTPFENDLSLWKSWDFTVFWPCHGTAVSKRVYNVQLPIRVEMKPRLWYCSFASWLSHYRHCAWLHQRMEAR
jgi:hypothetical protein